jgi:hypothetical protein
LNLIAQVEVGQWGTMIDLSAFSTRPIRLAAERSGGPERDSFSQRIFQDRIGRQLREMYSELMDQPVPEHLAALLGRLDEESRGGKE